MKCPAAYSGLEVTAEFWRLWEEYLFSRAAIAECHSHGIDLLDWSASLQPVAVDGRLTVRLTGPVEGLTPGGFPVVLETGESMTGTLMVGQRDGADLDLSVEVNPSDAGPE